MLYGLTPVNSFGYRFLFFLHIVAVVVAFAPAFVAPMLGRQRRATSPAPGETAPPPPPPQPTTRLLSPIVHGGALVLAGLFGIGMVGAAPNNSIEMSDPWISIAFLLWFLMLALFFVGLLPTEKKRAADDTVGDQRARLDQRMAMFYGGMHLLFLLQVINMVWQLT